MRMKLYFTLENEKMPIDYRRSIISFIKLSLSEYSENEFKKYYNQKDNIIKPYAFSIFFRDFHQIRKQTFAMFALPCIFSLI